MYITIAEIHLMCLEFSKAGHVAESIFCLTCGNISIYKSSINQDPRPVRSAVEIQSYGYNWLKKKTQGQVPLIQDAQPG